MYTTQISLQKKKLLRRKLVQDNHSQVCDDDTVNGMSEIAGLGDEGEIRVPTLILVAHVHSTIEHDILPPYRHNHTAFPNILSRPCHQFRINPSSPADLNPKP